PRRRSALRRRRPAYPAGAERPVVATAAPTPAAGVHRRRFLPRAEAPAAATLGGVVIVLLVLAAILAPVIAPHSPNAIDLGNTLAPSSGSYPFGRDSAGRDILSRLIFGA